MSVRIFAVGRIWRGKMDMVLAPQEPQNICDSYDLGTLDGGDGMPCQPLKYLAELKAIEAYICGWKDSQRT